MGENGNGSGGGSTKKSSGLKPPWPLGISGNPAGRAKGEIGFARWILEQTDDCKELARIALTIARDKKHKDQFRALEWLADRALGKVPMILDVNRTERHEEEILICILTDPVAREAAAVLTERSVLGATHTGGNGAQS